LVQFFHVFKDYRNQPALLDVNLAVDKGEFVFLTGPSGAGKSTLLKLIFCAERAQRGQILVNGRNIARIREGAVPFLRRNIGVVFQDFKLLPPASVFENVALALEVLGTPARDVQRRVLAVLKSVGLAHKVDMPAQRLSGGEQQRVAIARALVNDPAILLADEPTGRGTTVLVATHDRGLLSRYPRRTLTLEQGRILEDRR
jgi:cell division transport system ATP-binding protein